MASERLSALERLPDEILLLIVDGLDDVSAICLKNTNSNLKGKINRDPESFNRCTKWLIECRLESDLFKTIPIEQRPDKVTRYTCSMCKTKRSMDQIHGRGSGRKGVPFSIYDTGRLLCLNSTTRYCAKHPFFITWVKPTPGVPVSSRWTATPRRTCTHCAARVESSDSRANGCAKCQCDVCPPAKIRAHFTRYGALPKAARGGRPFIDGVLWWSGGKVLVSEVGSKLTSEHPFGREPSANAAS